ncbi:LOW QUALITY PROTEIN: hypothetical protein U9M48_028523 [Paspalum notatum var. saurae]|uniref:SWIM-type domain-containing protein n=1 Tax=Paspalum notatum var. saurae TaxID=547442 RepID=A0AAQ3U1F5_PASNO
MAPNTWVRAFFSEFPRCDILLNNNCEVFNKYILDAREMPILSMFERIKSQLMARHFNKAKELADEMWLCLSKDKLNKAAEYANICYALPSGQGVFQVLVKEYQHIVDIKAQTCDCRRWQLTGIPCSHAISCLWHERIPPESVLPICYSVEAYNCAYGNNIWPCKDKREWEHVQGLEILPPIYEKKPGRPPKSRRKQPHEVQGKHGPKLSKHGVVIHCKHCGEANHNSKGSSATATTANPPNDEPLNQEFNVSKGTSRLGEGANQFAEESGPSMVTQMLAQRPVPLTTATKVGKKASAAKTKKEPAASKNGNKKAKTGSLTKN